VSSSKISLVTDLSLGLRIFFGPLYVFYHLCVIYLIENFFPSVLLLYILKGTEPRDFPFPTALPGPNRHASRHIFFEFFRIFLVILLLSAL
jgi:hypothetical protein